tara:strand:+ start:890 stop:1189 length:300 start_codon:yes stop_codon:yes gene_type:complete
MEVYLWFSHIIIFLSLGFIHSCNSKDNILFNISYISYIYDVIFLVIVTMFYNLNIENILWIIWGLVIFHLHKIKDKDVENFLQGSLLIGGVILAAIIYY